jgi:hypothetical protein
MSELHRELDHVVIGAAPAAEALTASNRSRSS